MTDTYSAHSTSEAIGNVIAKLCYRASDELGAAFAERISKWRRNNAAKIVKRANDKYGEYSVSGKEHAHPRLVHNIIDEGSWTENDHVQTMWAGLLASSCTDNGDDESNIIFINILRQLTSLEAVILSHACENCKKMVTDAGWISAKKELTISLEELVSITGVSDFHRLDRELDHLRSLELILTGFLPTSTEANITPSALAIQLYVRCQGFNGSPVEYFNLDKGEEDSV